MNPGGVREELMDGYAAIRNRIVPEVVRYLVSNGQLLELYQPQYESCRKLLCERANGKYGVLVNGHLVFKVCVAVTAYPYIVLVLDAERDAYPSTLLHSDKDALINKRVDVDFHVAALSPA